MNSLSSLFGMAAQKAKIVDKKWAIMLHLTIKKIRRQREN